MLGSQNVAGFFITKIFPQLTQTLCDFEYNKLRDDVAWLRLRALREAGEVRAYERGLERFVKDYPESRYQRKLKEGVKP